MERDRERPIQRKKGKTERRSERFSKLKKREHGDKDRVGKRKRHRHRET